MDDIIKFGDEFPTLDSYEKQYWNINVTKNVEYFQNDFYKVTLTSVTSPDFPNFLNEIDVNEPIAIDLEWKTELCLFQFCYGNRVIIIRHPSGDGDLTLYNFLLTHTFFGKGTKNDRKQLSKKFGEGILDELELEDIETTRLSPYNHSINFVKMTLQFAGEPTTNFKEEKTTRSNWEASLLTVKQILYAGFDVAALFKCFKNFPEPKVAIQCRKINTPKVRKNTTQQNKNDIKIYEKDEFKSYKYRIIFKRSFARTAYCYIINHCKGGCDYISLNERFSFIPKEQIDFLSSLVVDNLPIVFLSLFSKLWDFIKFEDFKQEFSDDIQELPVLDCNESTDNDVIFLSNLSNFPFLNKDDKTINNFLCCFGSDARFLRGEDSIEFDALRVQPHCAQASLRMKSMIPFLKINDASIQLSIFPHYLPIVRAQIPLSLIESDNKIESISRLFSSYGEIKSIKAIPNLPTQTNQNAIIKFNKIEEAELAIKELNYRNGIYVQRYTDENHLRFLRFHQLIIDNNLNHTIDLKEANFQYDKGIPDKIDTKDEPNLRKLFNTFGKILEVNYDPRFNFTRVQFIERKHAEKAVESFPKVVRILPLNTMCFIRKIPLSISEDYILKIAREIGHPLNLIHRDLEENSETFIAEITFSTHEEAVNLKTKYHHSLLGESKLEINASTLDEIETPIWKMQQKRQWVTVFLAFFKNSQSPADFDQNKDNQFSNSETAEADKKDIVNNDDINTQVKQILHKCESIGKVVKMKEDPSKKIFIFFFKC